MLGTKLTNDFAYMCIGPQHNAGQAASFRLCAGPQRRAEQPA